MSDHKLPKSWVSQVRALHHRKKKDAPGEIKAVVLPMPISSTEGGPFPASGPCAGPGGPV